jgi:hypothetical protein
MALERRTAPLEIRAKGRQLEGYAATFGTVAEIGPGFRERIAAGAFRATLAQGRDVLALVDHDPGRVLGRTRSGTLQLSEDGKGLAFRLSLPDTGPARDVLALAERGDLGGMSFGFTARDEARDGDLRELRAVDLYEISVVSSWPAYPGTEVQARAGQPQPPGLAHAARVLRIWGAAA